ncbi:hypothetical protein [Geofilum rubicundum]|uniref:Uncharacterized protein n=1 Tax=Geofilum rubicundum JCM 15548 TaxID=1236989 RepID=A0A0E9LZX0_9BACT|nr:hypothetical protein [Geofilum rubicundum]GAO30676.1 hypothetical protein JCM15548_12977 [Geofilum rubicundum JCM 15548]
MLPLYHIERSQQAGFLGGTLTSVVVNISVADLMVTVILSIVGTLVSFLISMLLKRCLAKTPHRETPLKKNHQWVMVLMFERKAPWETKGPFIG